MNELILIANHKKTANFYVEVCEIDKYKKLKMKDIRFLKQSKFLFKCHWWDNQRRDSGYDYTDNIFKDLILKTYKKKLKFLKKHMEIVRMCGWLDTWSNGEKIGKERDYVYFFKFDEQLWSFIQQTYDFKSEYIDYLFSETEENKRMKKVEVESLLNKTLKDLNMEVRE